MVEPRLAAILDEVRSFCTAHSDPATAARYTRYFTEGYDPYGVEPQAWEAQLKAWTARLSAELDLDGCLDLGDLLFANGKYEEGILAVRVIARRRAELSGNAFQRVGRFYEFGVHNWAHSDTLCGEVLSPCLRDGRVSLADLADWRLSPFKFKRRAVPVAMLGLLKLKGLRDTPALLAFVGPMMRDGERVVQQGLGWFLRETWKLDRLPVEAFLLEWKDTAPRLIFQYATEKMSAAEKARFRRAKPGR
ncbi:MAG: DNA alkylation repair protein [Chloroflexota bacterium]